jgi:hypothetical protein
MIDLHEIANEIRILLEERRKELNLYFIEDDHKYFMNNLQGQTKSNWPSVSKVLKSFYPEFPTQEASFKKAKGDPIVQQKLIKEWSKMADYANNTGSRVHYFLEKKIIERFKIPKEVREPEFNCDFEQEITSDHMISYGVEFYEKMIKNGAVLIDTEVVMGDPELGYTGQADKIWLVTNKEKTQLGIVVTDWKGLPLDTDILTNNGWKTMDTLTIEDKVFDKDGNLVSINHISNIKNKKCLKMYFDNKEEIISDFEHRWLVFSISSDGKKKERVMTTQEIYDHYYNIKTRHSCKILKIENTKPLNLNKVGLPIDPYVYGIWLGDGHSSSGIITQANELVWKEIEKRGYLLGEDISGGGSGKAQSRTVFGLRKELRKLSLLGNKRLLEVFLLSSYEQRLDILRGLMDSDGYYNAKRKRFGISTTRINQIKFSVELLSSLGIKTTIISYNKTINDKKIKCYNIEFITTDFNPFLNRNQNINLEMKKDRRTYRRIVSIEEVDSVPTKCIEVDSPTNTFLCTRSMIVTHNTNKPKNFVETKWTIPMNEPYEDLPNTALGHYYVQLSLYAKLFRQMLKGTKYDDVKIVRATLILLKDSCYEEYKTPIGVINRTLELDVVSYIK